MIPRLARSLVVPTKAFILHKTIHTTHNLEGISEHLDFWIQGLEGSGAKAHKAIEKRGHNNFGGKKQDICHECKRSACHQVLPCLSD